MGVAECLRYDPEDARRASPRAAPALPAPSDAALLLLLPQVVPFKGLLESQEGGMKGASHEPAFKRVVLVSHLGRAPAPKDGPCEG